MTIGKPNSATGLERHHGTALAVPMRVAVGTLHQVLCQRLNPTGLDARRNTAVAA